MRFRYSPKNREVHAVKGVYCPAAYRRKLRYESEEKALNAIKFGNGDIIRAYYCKACHCWHTTSKPDKPQPWEEMSEFITDLYQIKVEKFEEVDEKEDEKMVFVKVVDNEEFGKVVLPGHFPVGVLAKRFGYSPQVPTDNITRMTDINAYVILEEGKLVVKQVEDRDKEGFLRSFAARFEEEFEATNTFTMEHEIFPKDLMREGEVGVYQPKIEVPRTEELRELVEAKATPAPRENRYDRLDVERFAGEFGREEAELALQKSLDYYLYELELKSIDRDKNRFPLSSLAVRGKGLLTYAVAEHFPKLEILEKLLSNESMQLALGRLGFYEFLEVDAHLAALFFEGLYAASALQGKHDIRRQLEMVLVGNQLSAAPKLDLVFKDVE